jgi:hypothetical protein
MRCSWSRGLSEYGGSIGFEVAARDVLLHT